MFNVLAELVAGAGRMANVTASNRRIIFMGVVGAGRGGMTREHDAKHGHCLAHTGRPLDNRLTRRRMSGPYLAE